MTNLRRLAALAPLLLAGACAAGPSPDPAPRTFLRASAATAISYAPWTDEDYRYRLGSGDELALRFPINPDLNAAVLVGPDGRGVFPLVGPVRVAGLTVSQANYALTNAYGSVLRNPQVETLVTTYGAAQIFVGGQVKEPGVKPVKGQLSVTQAVMLAGGFADDARYGQVVVLRQAPGEPRPHMRVVNVRRAVAGGDSGDFMLHPNDVVFVPRSAIGEVDLFVKQYITSLIPFSISYGVATNGVF